MKTNLFLLTGMAAIAAMSMLAVGCSGSSSEEGKKPTTDSKDLAIVLRPDASYAWTANDAVNVFQAVDGSTAYVSEGKFTIASGDISTNTFRGTLTEAPDKSKSYRYYVLYPYLSSSSSPAEARTSISTTQVQEGNDSKAHLAGSAFPLYGVSTPKTGSEQPSVQMNPLASVIEVDVLNSTDVTRTVSSVNITSTKTLCGTFKTDITGSEPALNDYGTSVSTSVTLNVNGGASITSGATGKFYIAVKPFSLQKEEVLTITVVTDLENPYVFEISPESGVNFTSGATVTENVELKNGGHSGFISEPCRLYVPGATSSANHIELGQPGDFDTLTYMTVEFWFKGEDNMVNNKVGMGYFISNYDGTYGWELGLQCKNNDPADQMPYRRIYIYRGGQDTQSINTENWPEGWHKGWHHICYRYTKDDETTSKVRVDVDGKTWIAAKSALPSIPDPETVKNQLYVFRDKNANNSVSGYIKKLRIWKRGMTNAEVAKLMTLEVDGTEEDLMAAWDFTETVADPTNIPDKTGHYYAKVLGDGVVWNLVSENWGEQDNDK